MWPDRVSNPGPLTYESGALPTALRGPGSHDKDRRTAPGARGHGSVPLRHSENVVTRIGLHTHTFGFAMQVCIWRSNCKIPFRFVPTLT